VRREMQTHVSNFATQAEINSLKKVVDVKASAEKLQKMIKTVKTSYLETSQALAEEVKNIKS
jgi:hypothetical protein